MKIQNLLPYGIVLWLGAATIMYAANPAKVKALRDFASRGDHAVYIVNGQTRNLNYRHLFVVLKDEHIECLIGSETFDGRINFIYAERLNEDTLLVFRDDQSDGSADEIRVRKIGRGDLLEGLISSLIDKPASIEADRTGIEITSKIFDIAVDRLHDYILK